MAERGLPVTSAPYDWKAVVARLIFSLFIVFSAYNPSGYSFWHWVTAGNGQFWLKLSVSLMLLGLHVILWRAVWAILRPSGVMFIALLCVCGFVALLELGILDGSDSDAALIYLMFSLAILLTSGLSTASIMHRLTGVQHVEEVPH